MTTRILKVFLDTSVIFAAILFPTGGARNLLRMGEIAIIDPVIGPNVLRECESVVRRKVPATLPVLAMILELSRVNVSRKPDEETLAFAKSIVSYPPDAHVLAEAIEAKPDWFVTHDKQHLLDIRDHPNLEVKTGSPGDLIQYLRDEWID